MTSNTATRKARFTAGAKSRAPFVLLLALMVASCVMSLELGLGTLASPQAGMWPFITSLLSALLVCALLVVPNLAAEGTEQVSRAQWHSLLLALPALTSYPVLLGLLGFVIPTAIVSFYWLRVVTRQSWQRTLVWSTVMTTSMYVVFVNLLAVPFPYGILPIR